MSRQVPPTSAARSMTRKSRRPARSSRIAAPSPENPLPTISTETWSGSGPVIDAVPWRMGHRLSPGEPAGPRPTVRILGLHAAGKPVAERGRAGPTLIGPGTSPGGRRRPSMSSRREQRGGKSHDHCRCAVRFTAHPFPAPSGPLTDRPFRSADRRVDLGPRMRCLQETLQCHAFALSRSDASNAFGMDDSSDDFDDFDDLHDQFDEPTTARRRGRPGRPAAVPRLVLEGKSGRTLVDSDAADGADDDGTAVATAGEPAVGRLRTPATTSPPTARSRCPTGW